MFWRESVKSLTRFVAQLVMAPWILWTYLVGVLAGRDRALEWSSQWVALLPGLSGQYLRRAFLAWTIEECHPTAVVCFGTIFSKTDVRLGANTYIGPYCSLGSAVIGRDVLVAAMVQIPSGARNHGIGDITRPIREQPGDSIRVRIGAGSWIGSSAVVMADVGEDSVIGAGAVVTRPIPARVVAGGVPAKVIKSRHGCLTESG